MAKSKKAAAAKASAAVATAAAGTTRKKQPKQAAVAVLQELAVHAAKVCSDADVDASNLFKAVMDTFPQGDVYITYLGKNMADAAAVINEKLTEIPLVQQLAPGNTQGSRHLLRHLTGVQMFRRPNPQECDGAILVLNKSNDICHPEHGNLVNIPPGVYGVTYQQTGDQIRRRVRD